MERRYKKRQRRLCEAEIKLVSITKQAVLKEKKGGQEKSEWQLSLNIITLLVFFFLCQLARQTGEHLLSERRKTAKKWQSLTKTKKKIKKRNKLSQCHLYSTSLFLWGLRSHLSDDSDVISNDRQREVQAEWRKETKNEKRERVASKNHSCSEQQTKELRKQN